MGSVTVSWTDMRGLRLANGSWNTIWMRARMALSAAGESVAKSCPSKRMRPDVALSSRRIRRVSVVFPEPLSPTRPKLSPAWTESETS